MKVVKIIAILMIAAVLLAMVTSSALSVEEKCIRCDGKKDCQVCSGSGKNLSGNDCSMCSGTGKCYYCNGTGKKS
ncbi:MAG: hypothetical protein RDV48_20515 [Candidatus Eremiobacteraeota bacterium]|nr:hypothetical protein [Candidatus Eremiobacteraeota bacterium]